ncbi:hypothetical protein M0802_010360 [Mischocyttarus mexicanus]|nr:hypothetical protein M0802_010360 [Mischocyttarus mexicanus]
MRGEVYYMPSTKYQPEVVVRRVFITAAICQAIVITALSNPSRTNVYSSRHATSKNHHQPSSPSLSPPTEPPSQPPPPPTTTLD